MTEVPNEEFIETCGGWERCVYARYLVWVNRMREKGRIVNDVPKPDGCDLRRKNCRARINVRAELKSVGVGGSGL